jgi:hypothetical protein
MADLEQLLIQSRELKDMLKKLSEKAAKLETEIVDAKDRQIESDKRTKSQKR